MSKYPNYVTPSHPQSSYTCTDQSVTCSQATANPVSGKACSSTKGGLLRYIPNTYSIHKVSSLKFAYFQGKLSRHITSRLGTTWVRQLRSHHPTAATKCNVQPSQATATRPRQWKSMLFHQGWFTALYTQHLLDSQSLEFEICIFPREAIPSQKFVNPHPTSIGITRLKYTQKHADKRSTPLTPQVPAIMYPNTTLKEATSFSQDSTSFSSYIHCSCDPITGRPQDTLQKGHYPAHNQDRSSIFREGT